MFIFNMIEKWKTFWKKLISFSVEFHIIKLHHTWIQLMNRFECQSIIIYSESNWLWIFFEIRHFSLNGLMMIKYVCVCMLNALFFLTRNSVCVEFPQKFLWCLRVWLVKRFDLNMKNKNGKTVRSINRVVRWWWR